MINQIKENIFQLHFTQFGSTVYIVKTPEPILIDASTIENSEELVENLKELNISPEDINSIILTHSHWDHTGNLNLFPNAKIYSATNFKEMKEKFLDFKFYKTPGHTRDSICILYENVLFSGDTIFDKNHTYIGRTDLPESNEEDMQKSLEFLKTLNYEMICPGHLT